jgi:hypothetical protein
MVSHPSSSFFWILCATSNTCNLEIVQILEVRQAKGQARTCDAEKELPLRNTVGQSQSVINKLRFEQSVRTIYLAKWGSPVITILLKCEINWEHN